MEQIYRQAMQDVGRSVQESVAGVQALERLLQDHEGSFGRDERKLASAYQVSRVRSGDTLAPSMPTEPPIVRTLPPRSA